MELANKGYDVTLEINVKDLHNASELPVSSATVQASLRRQTEIERAWSRYLDSPRKRDWLKQGALRLARRAKRAVRKPPPHTLERLLNIELSHLNLLQTGTTVGTDWILILEDDAICLDLVDLLEGLTDLIDREGPVPAYVDLSRSFTHSELGITHLLRPSGAAWAGREHRQIVASTKPVSNTVCAILYRTAFAASVLDVWESLPIEPVIPIDWKLNVALMYLFERGALQPSDCWLIDPGPIDQMSMRQRA